MAHRPPGTRRHRRLKLEGEELAEYGPAREPSKVGMDDVLTGDQGAHYKADPTGRRTGHGMPRLPSHSPPSCAHHAHCWPLRSSPSDAASLTQRPFRTWPRCCGKHSRMRRLLCPRCARSLSPSRTARTWTAHFQLQICALFPYCPWHSYPELFMVCNVLLCPSSQACRGTNTYRVDTRTWRCTAAWAAGRTK
jgi:hypothetical protein